MVLMTTGPAGMPTGSSISLSFPLLLGVKPVRSELVYLLVSLDKDYTAGQPGDTWESYYAQRILGHFSRSGS